MLIRTSGEMRVSNFLLWQISYTELVVTQTLWPDFRKPQLYAALRSTIGGIGGLEDCKEGMSDEWPVTGKSWQE